MPTIAFEFDIGKYGDGTACLKVRNDCLIELLPPPQGQLDSAAGLKAIIINRHHWRSIHAGRLRASRRSRAELRHQ